MNTMTNNQEKRVTSVLAQLRRLNPERPLRIPEALRVAELQATRFRELTATSSWLAPTRLVTTQPHITVQADTAMPDGISGATDWAPDQACWLIAVNPRQPRTRQRFTVFHEYKHIVDHHRSAIVDGSLRRQGLPAAEYVADYFAGCVLVPRQLLKRAWASGVQQVGQLARLFDVSERAVEVRLEQVGLAWHDGRCPTREAAELVA